MNTSQSSERDGVAETRLEPLLSEYAVAKFYDVSVATVRRWRWLRTGPKFHKLGVLCRYRIGDLEEYLRSTRTGGIMTPDSPILKAALAPNRDYVPAELKQLSQYAAERPAWGVAI